MRTRSIKPGFFSNEQIADLPPLARLLFIGLWTIADREGRLEDRPRRIKKELLGYDDITENTVDQYLNAMARIGIIKRYRAGGERYIWIVNFKKHQNPHIKEQASEIPTWEQRDPDEPGPAPGKHETDPERDPEADKLSAKRQAAIIGARKLEARTAELFEQFWSAYPKKTHRRAAEAEWQKIPLIRLEPTMPAILQAIKRQKQTPSWQKENGQYIPNPAAWIKDERWTDQTAPSKEPPSYDLEEYERRSNAGPPPYKTNAQRAAEAAARKVAIEAAARERAEEAARLELLEQYGQAEEETP